MRNVMVAAFGAFALTLAGPSMAQHHGGFHGGFHGGHMSGHFHGGFHGHGLHSSVVFFAPPLFWGPAYYGYAYPYYAPYPMTYAPPAPVTWYCPGLGYYPAVPACSRWVQVVPPSGAAY